MVPMAQVAWLAMAEAQARAILAGYAQVAQAAHPRAGAQEELAEMVARQERIQVAMGVPALEAHQAGMEEMEAILASQVLPVAMAPLAWRE